MCNKMCVAYYTYEEYTGNIVEYIYFYKLSKQIFYSFEYSILLSYTPINEYDDGQGRDQGGMRVSHPSLDILFFI